MVRVTDEVALSPKAVSLYYATDPLLGHLPVLAFHGPSTTANFTLNSSRIQVHLYSPAGFQSFPRLTVSPSSDLYGVVNHLPREFQGDDVCRGLAFALYKYFRELPEPVKTHLRNQYPTTRGRRPGSAPALFAEQHAADLAKAMARVESLAVVDQLMRGLHCALQPQHVTNIDLDLVLPPGAVTPLPLDGDNSDSALGADDDEDDDVLLDPTLRQYDPAYRPLVKLFGEPVFLPTSKLRRAPSRPSSLNHRSKTFTKDQKVDLRMQMGELVDTEERYVLKLNELVRHIADSFRQDAVRDSTTANRSPTDPTAEDLDRLFPPSSDRILQVNAAFMQDLRRVMDDSEDDAVRDLGVPYTFGSASSRTMGRGGDNGSVRTKDPTGALAMAKTFLEWFPRFSDCYQDYIRASQHFPQLLSRFLDSGSVADAGPTFRDRVMQMTGEQALRSILIEPVQRLPRYSLFIDQIVGCLPINHPALQPMLKARDIITNICSMDDPLESKPHTISRLRNLIESWPLDLEPRGRLVLAADFVELPAPFDTDAASLATSTLTQERAGLLLLFGDCLVLVKKKISPQGSVLTGRDLLREIDKPSPAGLLASMTNAAGGPGTYDFAFGGWHELASVRFTESADGRLVWMTSTQEMKGAQAGEGIASKAITSRCFVLQEAFEGRATRWSEDLVKARIEGRFSEAERETPTWTLRSARLPDNNNMGLHAAVFEEAAEQLIEGRREPAPVRVVFDNHRGTKGAPVGHYGVEIVVEVRTDVGRSSISTTNSGRGSRAGDGNRLVMNTLGLNGKRYSDDVDQEDFLPTLSRRIIQLMSLQHNPSNPRLVPALVSYHTKVLRSMNFSTRSEKTRSFLTSSPVKLFSSFLGGGTSNPGSTGANNTSPAAATASTATASENVYGSLRRHRSQSNSSRHNPETASLTGSIRDRHGVPIGMDAPRPENPLVRLEQTFTGYVAALQARKGEFVARTLMNRGASSADELSINVLYNKLNESPFDWESSSDLPPEIVFAAFEKFTRIAWRDQMGTIMTIQSLDALQERAVRKVPGDFADFVNFLFADMAPQNRRAFTALMKLLADLLDGCLDDGDRGALTLAFAELLVTDSGDPHNYINLLDRLVEDCDRIFGDGSLPSSIELRSSAYESLSSTARSHMSSVSGSMTSNTSSLRRKFGLESLLRQTNSAKSSSMENMAGGADAGGGGGSGSGNGNGEPERQSMWRSLSKHHRHPATGESSSLSKASASQFINRSRSIDMGNHSPASAANMNKPMRRPVSRDRPPVAGAFDDTLLQAHLQQRPMSSHRPNSSHQQLETIGEPAGEPNDTPSKTELSARRAGGLKKKRRSSLSDLKSLMAAATLEDDGPLPPVPPKESHLAPVPLRATKLTSEKLNAAGNTTPRTQSPSKIPISPQSGTQPQFLAAQNPFDHRRQNSQPQSKQQAQSSALPSLPQKEENLPTAAASPQLPKQKTVATSTTTATATTTATTLATVKTAIASPVPASGKTLLGPGSSQIPTLKAPRVAGTVLPLPGSESPTRQSKAPLPPSPTKLSAAGTGVSGLNQRLRLQSPQKLRERLQTEKKAAEEVDTALQSELSRISEDMARLNGGAAVARGASKGAAAPAAASSAVDAQSLAAALKALEERVPRLIQEVADRQAALQKDMDATVKASEGKVRAVDQLYKEARAENELLYEKFNTELGKIVRALKGKGREDREELVAKLKEQSEETARLKKENARLRREAVSLRTLLKGGEQAMP